jgi:hypothetical protein
MSTLHTLKKLVLGETWMLPAGLTAVLLAALVARPLLEGAWKTAGGFVLLAGVCAVLASSVSASAGPRRRDRHGASGRGVASVHEPTHPRGRR